jgi:two-component system NtrC family sensor kinase
VAACFAVSPEYEAFIRQQSFTPGRGTITGRVVLERRPVQVADFAADPELAVPKAATIGNIRTMLGVPLMQQGEPIGAIGVARQRVEPFSEQQIELVSTFADQAVIAIENARLITETREALEQQTATAEVLGVINSSPGDLAPVFDAMLEKALSLCSAAIGELHTYDGEHFTAAAIRGETPAYVEARATNPAAGRPGTASRRVLETKRPVHILDMQIEAQNRPAESRALIELSRIRTSLTVPLLRDEALLGFIRVYRREVRPFTDQQIALLENFAAQAVIAMENARLITETREALEQQTATAEVLQVINSSPGDLAPVFDAMLEKAHSLCGAAHGVLVLRDGENFRAVGARGLPDGFAERLKSGSRAPATRLPNRCLPVRRLSSWLM